MINRIKTDKEVLQEAARKLAFATTALVGAEEYDQACIDMVEALRYTQSIEWWKQFEDAQREVAPPVDWWLTWEAV